MDDKQEKKEEKKVEPVAEEKKPEGAAGDNDDGKEAKEETPEEQPKGMVADAHLAAERIEAANKETKNLIERAEKLEAQRALGGGSPAGSEPEEKKEETPKDYKDRVMAGDV